MSIDLNEGQRLAYDSDARIVVVPACPGSGKTRLFVAAVLKEFGVQRKGHQGVAAISFTNAAEQEISARMTSGVNYPNFVGTIDSFLLRYIVRPFGGHLVNFNRFSYPSAPDEFGVQDVHIEIPNRTHPISLAKIELVRVDGTTKVIAEKVEIVDANAKKAISDAKKLAWQRGEVVHNDICFIAALLLEKVPIRKVVLERFVSILVDEFQDVAGSRESAILQLLRDEKLRKGFVVGDPNQSIMQFAGARADLFIDVSAIPGAFTTPLTETHRFNASIGISASHLAVDAHNLQYSNLPVHSRHTTALLHHDCPVREDEYSAELEAFRRFLKVNNTPQEANSSPIVLVRKTKLVNRLKGEYSAEINFGCRLLESLYRVAFDFEVGRMSEVMRATERALCTLCGFGGTQPTDEEIASKGLSMSSWRQKVWEVALSFSKFDHEITLEQWFLRGRETLQRVITETDSGVALGQKYKLMKTSIGSVNLQTPLRTLISKIDNQLPIEFSNIHQSKGREYPAVCILIPRPSSNEESYVSAWFQNPHSEEARIAYVALTRPKHGLMVILPQVVVEDLCSSESGKLFVESFNYRGSVSEYLNDFPDLNSN